MSSDQQADTETNVWAADASPHAALTLIACYPFAYVGRAPRRFIVDAEWVENASGSPPTTATEEDAYAMTIAALTALRSRIPWCEPAVLESSLELALEIAREGREGRRIGTLFTLGKADEVLAASRPLILDPLAGHAPTRTLPALRRPRHRCVRKRRGARVPSRTNRSHSDSRAVAAGPPPHSAQRRHGWSRRSATPGDGNAERRLVGTVTTLAKRCHRRMNFLVQQAITFIPRATYVSSMSQSREISARVTSPLGGGTEPVVSDASACAMYPVGSAASRGTSIGNWRGPTK